MNKQYIHIAVIRTEVLDDKFAMSLPDWNESSGMIENQFNRKYPDHKLLVVLTRNDADEAKAKASGQLTVEIGFIPKPAQLKNKYWFNHKICDLPVDPTFKFIDE